MNDQNSSKHQTSPERVRKLTPQQSAALAIDKNISVTAGAGSGKTTILVERYLKIILDELVNVRDVLAITFTEKAAAEMTERVSRMLRERLLQEDNPRQRARLLELRERLNSAQISTIHAFCARILREFAVASGVDPDFSVLGEFQLELLINATVEEVFDQLDNRKLESAYSDEDWKELLRQIPVNFLKEIFSVTLAHRYEMNRFRQRLEAATDEQLLAEAQQIFFEKLEANVDTAQLLRDALPLLKQIDAEVVPLANLKPKGQQAFELIDKFLAIREPESEKIEFWQLLIDLSLLMATSEGQPFKIPSALGKKDDLKDTYELFKELSARIHLLYRFTQSYFSTVPGRLDLLCIRALRKIMALHQIIEKRYEEKKEERGMLDFDDLQLLALEMLQNHEHVRNTLRNRYHYVMVDEFQDTNDLQWEIISLLGTIDGELQEDKFFVVGDPKQSIYGFRNADVRVFRQVKDTFAKPHRDNGEYPGNIVLQESFRFQTNINRFVNYLFERILGVDRENEFDVAYEALDTRREVAETSHIEIAFLSKEDSKAHKMISQGDYIARAIRKLLGISEGVESVSVYQRSGAGEVLRSICPGDIAILIPRRTHLLELESKLRRYGIPFKTIGGVGFYRRQEIFDVYHLLRYLDNPSDELAFLGVLRSPFAGISDAGLFCLSLEKRPYETYRQALARITDFSQFPEADRRQLPVFTRQLARWERRRDRLSLSRLLTEIFDESFYRVTVAVEWNGEQLLANIDKIVEMAREYEQGGFMSLADFIDSLHQTIHQDPREGEAQIAMEDEGTVKIMTVHQAKGLEFPVVFYPDLQQTIRNDPGKVRLDSDTGLGVKIRDPQNGYREMTPFLFQWIDYRQKQKQLAELKRLFYVAVTRARDRVYLVSAYQNSDLQKDNCLGWTARALDFDPLTFTEESLTIDGNLTVHMTLKIDPEELKTALYQDVEPGIKQVEETLREPQERSAEANLPIDLLPVSDHPKGVVFSATQLLTFRNDPENYFRRYHLGFFESDYEFLKQVSDPDTMSLVKGKIVHKILEDGIPASGANLQNRLEQCFFFYEIFDEEQQKELCEEIPRLLNPFVRSEFAKKIFSADEWKTEISLTMRLGSDYLTGTLDRLFRNTAGEWEVADYKTNKITASEVKKIGRKYEMQMQTYALLTAQLFPGQSAYPVSLYFLLPEQEYRIVYTPEDVKNIYIEFTEIIEQIKQYYPFGERLLGE
jgi:ATP-dependent helicase/nuclease subunit A